MVAKKQVQTGTPRKRGRKSISFAFEEYLSLLEQGKTKLQIAGQMGMSYSTLYKNIEELREKAKEEGNLEFFEDTIKKSEAVGKKVIISNHWELGLELSKKYPAIWIVIYKILTGWKDTTRQELTGADGSPIEFDQKEIVRKLSNEQLIALARLEEKENATTEPENRQKSSSRRTKKT